MEAATPQMAALLKSGQAQTLQDAYDKSVWMVPEIRDQMIKSSQEQDTEEKTRRVQRAKRAGREVRSETAPVESTRPMSLRDTLRQAMAASQ
jgi:predicted Zn-dependent peptidase